MNTRLRNISNGTYVDFFLMIGLLGFALLFFLIIRKPPFMSDPLDYFFSSTNLLDLRPTHRHLRYGLLWPIWALQQIFGYSEVSYYFLPLLGFLTLSIGTFFLGRLLFGRIVGLFGGLLILLNPAIVENGTRLFPDFLSAGLFSLTFVIVIHLGQRAYLRQNYLSLPSRGLLIVGGLFLGWSYLIREHVAILFPCIAIVLWTYRSKIMSILWLAGAALLPFLAEIAWSWYIYGSPFIRFMVSSSPRHTSFFEDSIVEILYQLPSLFVAEGAGLLFIPLLFLGVLGSLWFRKRNPERWTGLTIWFFGGWIFFTAVSLLPILTTEGSVLLRMHRMRYWVIIFPPMIIAGVGSLHLLIEHWSLRPTTCRINISHLLLAVFSVLFVLLSFQNVRQMLNNGDHVLFGNADYQEFRNFIRQNGSEYEVIWLNQGSLTSAQMTIPFYLSEWHGLSEVWDGEIDFYNTNYLEYSDLSDLASGLLVIDFTRRDALIEGHLLPDYILNPDLLGTPVFSSTNERILAYVLPPRK